MTAKPSMNEDWFLDRTIRDVPLNQLRPGKGNPRIDLRSAAPKRFAELKASIKRGFFEPIKVIGSTMEVVAGHQRLEVCRDLQRTTIPVLFLKDLTETQKKEVRIADNSHAGMWSLPLLRDDISAIPKEDIAILGLDELTLSNLDLTPVLSDAAGGEDANQEQEQWTTFKIPRMPAEADARIHEILEGVMKAQKCKKAAALTYICELFAQDPSLFQSQ